MTAGGRAAALLLAAVAACSPPPTELDDLAETALKEGRYADARSLAERGLDAAGHDVDEFTRWTLNRVRLEALAASADATTVVQEVDALAPTFPQRIDSSLWVRLGRAALDGGHLEPAITLLEAGCERHPDEVDKFKAVLLDVRKAAEETDDDEALARLRQNPYLR